MNWGFMSDHGFDLPMFHQYYSCNIENKILICIKSCVTDQTVLPSPLYTYRGKGIRCSCPLASGSIWNHVKWIYTSQQSHFHSH